MAQLKIRRYIYSILAFFSLLGVAETLLVRGFMFTESPFVQMATRMGFTLIIVLYLVWVAVGIFGTGWRLRAFVPDMMLAAMLIGNVFPLSVESSIVSFRIALSLLFAFLRTTGFTAFLKVIQLNPARILLISFLGAIAIGTLLLMLPASTTDHRGAAFIDALFTATSAVCVTGLIVKDTGTFFTGFGQAVILILIQVGGLGIMTLATLYTLLLGRRLGWKQEAHMREITESSGVPQMYHLIVGIVTITLVLECAGSLILYLHLLPDMGPYPAAKSAVFHCVSAFCNAGFSLFPANLMDFAGDWVVNLVIMVLIIFGGLGFVVIDDIRANMRGMNPLRIRWSRLTVYTRMVVITTAWLIVLGMLTILYLEFDNTMLRLGSMEKLLAAAFQSVTCRTAGYNTIDITACRDATLFVMILLMFIGASPASTGGGIKTATFAVLTLAARANLKSRSRVEVYEKSIPPETVYKAVAILLFSSSFVIVFTMLLLMTQKGGFLPIIFEAVSAIGTVGLSAGMTPHLDTTGKLLISILMYVGRVGPLSIALALGEPRKVTMEFPTTRILVG
jgi:trk system potassium uptake protein TrkH